MGGGRLSRRGRVRPAVRRRMRVRPGGNRRKPGQDWPGNPIRAKSWLGLQSKPVEWIRRGFPAKICQKGRHRGILDGFAHGNSPNQHSAPFNYIPMSVDSGLGASVDSVWVVTRQSDPPNSDVEIDSGPTGKAPTPAPNCCYSGPLFTSRVSAASAPMPRAPVGSQ